MNIEELVDLSARMVQFDWAEIFIGPQRSFLNGVGDLPYEQAIFEFAVTLRCVDDEYFYIYGADFRLRDLLLGHLRPLESKEGLIGELDFPS